MTRTAPCEARKKIEADFEVKTAVNMEIKDTINSVAHFRWTSSPVLTNTYALALGILCGHYPSTATLAFTITALTGITMLLSKAYSNEYHPSSKANTEVARSGQTEKGSFRITLQLVPIIGSLAILSVLFPWRFSALVVGFIVPVWLFIENEIHEALTAEGYLPELRQAWECGNGSKCVTDECLNAAESVEPKIEIVTWIVFAWLVSMVCQSPGWVASVESALRHGS